MISAGGLTNVIRSAGQSALTEPILWHPPKWDIVSPLFWVQAEVNQGTKNLYAAGSCPSCLSKGVKTCRGPQPGEALTRYVLS